MKCDCPLKHATMKQPGMANAKNWAKGGRALKLQQKWCWLLVKQQYEATYYILLVKYMVKLLIS